VLELNENENILPFRNFYQGVTKTTL